MKNKKIPKKLQAILWSVDVSKLDLERDKWYIIYQVLIYGDFNDIGWLLETYGKGEVVNVFLNKPSKNYPAVIYNFIKNYILGLSDEVLDKNSYVTSIHGPVRPRAAAGF